MNTDAEAVDHDADGHALIGACYVVYNETGRRVRDLVNFGTFPKLDWHRRVG